MLKMLQLQLKSLVVLKLPKKFIFFIKLSFLCATIHILLLLLLFLAQHNEKLFLDTRRTTDAPILFVPLLKTAIIHEQKNSGIPMIVSSAVQEKKSIPAVVPIKKQMEQKKIDQKPHVKKPVPKKVVAKKTAVKKPAPKPVIQKKKDPVAKQHNKPIVQEPKKEAPKKADETIITKDHTPTQEIIVGRHDLELLTLSNELKDKIIKIWKRPANIPLQAVCQARITVQNDGTRVVVIEQSSGALALDVSVRNFLLQYDFPHSMIGKELSIIF